MKADYSKELRYQQAKNKVSKQKGFYIHLCAYVVVLCLLIYNYFIIEESEYMQAIIWLNSSIMVVWGIVVLFQGWTAFKGSILFGKKWEEKKIRKYMEEDKKQIWE
jgi:hypothetical protein